MGLWWKKRHRRRRTAQRRRRRFFFKKSREKENAERRKKPANDGRKKSLIYLFFIYGLRDDCISGIIVEFFTLEIPANFLRNWSFVLQAQRESSTTWVIASKRFAFKWKVVDLGSLIGLSIELSRRKGKRERKKKKTCVCFFRCKKLPYELSLLQNWN